MNLVNCYVTEIIGKPFKCKNTHCWGLEVKYDSYGNESTTKIFLDTKAEILKIKIGHEFLH